MTHTHVQPKYFMPRGSAHRGIIMGTENQAINFYGTFMGQDSKQSFFDHNKLTQTLNPSMPTV